MTVVARGHRWREDRGSAGGLALIALLAVAALMVVLGLVVDGGAKAAAADRANRIAMEAARAGAQVLTQQGGVDEVVQQYLAAEGVSGTVVVSADRVDVTVELTEPTKVLSLIGYSRIKVTGHGFALADYASASG